MIGLDTNVLVRYIMRDDTVQTELATRLVGSLDESEPGFISVIALVETVWIMTRVYEPSSRNHRRHSPSPRRCRDHT